MRSDGLSDSIVDALGLELPRWTFWAMTGVVGLVLLTIIARHDVSRRGMP